MVLVVGLELGLLGLGIGGLSGEANLELLG